MITRFKILLGWILFVPFVFTVGFLFIPMYMLYDVDTFCWLDKYIDRITSPKQTG